MTIFVLFGMGLPGMGPSMAQAARDYSSHSGYLSTTEGEREATYKDMVVIQPPSDEGPTLRERIFNDKLSKEFSDRYAEKFGRTEVERVYLSPNRYTYYHDAYGFKGTSIDMNNERQRFAEFMLRRLLEFHADNYAKSDPKVRPVWEAKERLSKVALEIDRFRFDAQYSVAGNTFDLKVVNPWLQMAQLRMEMDPGVFGPTQPHEMIVSLGRPLTSTITLEGHYRITDGIVSVIGRKALSPQVMTSLSTSTFTRDSGKSPRESVYLAGMSLVF